MTDCFELPILTADPPHDFHVDGLPPIASTPLGFPLPFAIPTGTSCYLDETVQLQATRCLRFTSDVKNAGGGRLDIRVPWLSATGQSGFLPGQCAAEQVVRRTSGATVVRPAGPCEFHLAHVHFHYKDLVGFSLHALQSDGSPGPSIGAGLKESFCLGDNDYFGFGTAGPTARARTPASLTATCPRRWVAGPSSSRKASHPDGATCTHGIHPASSSTSAPCRPAAMS